MLTVPQATTWPLPLALSTLLPTCHPPLCQPVSRQHTRPNTLIHYPVFTTHSDPMPAGPLKYPGWRKLTASYRDPEGVKAILGICRFGARVGYEGHRTSVTIHPNLRSALDNPVTVTREIQNEIANNRLERYAHYSALPPDFTSSPLGLTDKSDGSKRRIHHLWFPAAYPFSINSGIPERYGTIDYSRISKAISAIQTFGKASRLIKRDFENAFRHIPIARDESLLLGFEW